jgi:hypothetical protein
MVSKELIEFSNSDSQTSVAMESVIEEILKGNPDVSYTRVNYDKDPDLVKAIIASQPPTISPFFVGFNDGKISGSAVGLVSAEDLAKILSL